MEKIFQNNLNIFLLLKNDLGLIRQSSFRRHDPELGQLRLQDGSRDGRFNDVGPIETVDAINA